MSSATRSIAHVRVDDTAVYGVDHERADEYGAYVRNGTVVARGQRVIEQEQPARHFIIVRIVADAERIAGEDGGVDREGGRYAVGIVG